MTSELQHNTIISNNILLYTYLYSYVKDEILLTRIEQHNNIIVHYHSKYQSDGKKQPLKNILSMRISGKIYKVGILRELYMIIRR